MGQAQTNVHQLPATPSMADLDRLAKIYYDKRDELGAVVGEMEAEIEAIKRKFMRSLKAKVSNAKEAENELKNAVSIAPELFEKPKAVILHGIKCGFRKKPGQLTWDDDAYVCDKIEKHFAEQADVLIKTTRKPVDKALRNLQAGDLLKLGIKLDKDIDEPVVAAVDSEVDKLVEALMKDSEKYDS
jgi:hypothetical protein